MTKDLTTQPRSTEGAFDIPAKPSDKPTTEKPKDKKTGEDDVEKVRRERWVKQWNERIIKARDKWDPDFKRMKADMRFARGFQWEGQQTLESDKYVCNLTLRNISQGVATLYARNPTIEAQRRDRLDFTIWDGKEESIQAAVQGANQAALTGQPINPLALQMIQDYSEGQMWRELVDRVGKTVTFVAQYMLDSLQPDFKLQMKQLVRRVKTTGVGYVQINYVDGLEGTLSTSETESTITDRIKQLKQIAQDLDDDKITDESPEVLTLANLGASIMASVQTGDTGNINQRITLDFLPSTSVIIDPRCRHLKGFVGARWIAIERVLDLSTVNAFYETDIKAADVKSYEASGNSQQDTAAKDTSSTSPAEKKRVCLFDVYDLDTKSCFVICDGWKDFVQAPEAVMPETNHFWPIVALTFNDVETEPDGGSEGCSIFPPSDVALMRNSQKEWNRSRQAWRSHRVANTPAYLTGKGWLTLDDMNKINNHEDSAVVELEGAQMGQDIGKLLAPFEHSPIQPLLYDTNPLAQDIQLSAGTQEADLGRPTPKVTATGATIAEQSKNTVAASNTDDLDDFLSTIAQMFGEIILRYFQLDTVQRIAGRGAVLPQQNREDFLNEIMLSVKAASSGRPNKALDIANFKELAPLIIQAITNPTGPMIGLAEEGIKRLDDRLDLTKILAVGLPLPGAMMMAQQGQQQQAPQPGQPAGPAKPQTPPAQHQPLPNGQPVHET
jgi:hypothetical protein